MDMSAKRPEGNADAASIVRFRADMVAARAKKLGQVADATVKLQAALTPEQRKTFDQIVRHSHRRHNHHRRNQLTHHGQHGPDGDHWQRDGR